MNSPRQILTDALQIQTGIIKTINPIGIQNWVGLFINHQSPLHRMGTGCVEIGYWSNDGAGEVLAYIPPQPQIPDFGPLRSRDPQNQILCVRFMKNRPGDRSGFRKARWTGDQD